MDEMNSTENVPFRYIILPEFIIRDNEIPEGAKILFGEIAALSLREGYCYCTNGYISKIFSGSKRNASRWIRSLRERLYVTVELIRKDGSGRIRERQIQPNTGLMQVDRFMNWYGHFRHEGNDRNVIQGNDKNGTDINITGNNTLSDIRTRTVKKHHPHAIGRDRIPENELADIPF